MRHLKNIYHLQIKKIRFIALAIILVVFVQGRFIAQSIIINHHDVAAFDSIPEMYKQDAAAIRMLFMDRSVGFNISTYLDCLSTPWSSALSSCKRYQHQDTLYNVDPAEVQWTGTWDRSNWSYAFWPGSCSEDVTCFIDYMDERLDSFDVFGCQFSYLAVLEGSSIADSVTGFFGHVGGPNKADTYSAYASAHPDKKVIWWTTSLARAIGTQESTSFNDQMREFATSHDIILFDVADILSYDPSGNPCFDNRDGVTYKTENYPDDGLDLPAICPQYTTETDGGHLGSISAGGIRVTKALWVLMARLAGWTGVLTSTRDPYPSRIRLFPNPASDYAYLDIPYVSDGSAGEVVLFDGLGRIHFRLQVPASSHMISNHVRLPLTGIDSGLYFVQYRSGEMKLTGKLFVNRNE